RPGVDRCAERPAPGARDGRRRAAARPRALHAGDDVRRLSAAVPENARPMKPPIGVIHLIGSTGLYGAQRWILALLRHLSSERVQSTVVNLVDRPDAVSDLVTTARQRGIPALDFYTGGRFNPMGAVRLARLVREQRSGVLHSHGYKADVLAL